VGAGGEPDRGGQLGYSDLWALSDDDRSQALETIGVPQQVSAAGVIDAVPIASSWLDSLAGAIERNDLAGWGERIASDEDFAALLYETLMKGDMGGQLFVRTVEVPESLPRKASLAVARIDPDAFFNLPFEEAIASFRERRLISPAEYRRLSDAAKARAFSVSRMTSDELVRRVQEILQRELESGASLQSFVDQVRDGEVDLGITATSPSYLENIFRTNTQSAYGAGRLRQMTDPVVVAARPYVEYRTARDNRVRPSHAALNRVVFRQDDPGWTRYNPPLGFQCFVAETTVSGSFLAAVRALYTGEFVELRTDTGRSVTVTANHPLATVDGFVPANLIHEGHEVLCHQAPVWVSLDGEIDPQNRPASAEDVFNALPVRNSSKIRVVPEDFHGEAKFWSGDIDAVTVDGVLLNRPHPEAGQQISDVGFSVADERLPSESSGNRLGDGFCALGNTSSSGVCGGDLPHTGLSGHLRPLDPFRVGPASDLASGLFEPTADDVTSDPAFCRKLLDGSAGVVALEKVISVRRFNSTRHVFDLQTETGVLVAGGIVTSNCRCTVVTRRAEQVDLTRVVDSATLDIQPDPGFGNPR
jgi:SPP1 gp7 family putative phage head morphogenesis protein